MKDTAVQKQRSSNLKISTPKDLVTDFGLAKKLKELGLDLPTFFYYIYFPNTGKHFIYRNKTAFKTYSHNVNRNIECQLIPAPLSEELMNVLPEMYRTYWKKGKNVDHKTWFCSKGDLSDINIIIKTGKKESSARAKMLIHLLENDPEFVPGTID